MTEKAKAYRGFATLDPAIRREIAARGGRAAHAGGKGRVWTAEAASIAGKKGGRAVAADREHMSALGREGGRMRRLAADAARDVHTGGDHAVPRSAIASPSARLEHLDMP
ncbi:MAG: hypothetical protein MUD17_03495 [Gemmatimonadaceae bacterium]|jgi:general stress protein YciG|nr:hypothetical protein [Gemmatimonadaceae bacterium]